MADTKISALSSGAPAQGTDETVIARSGSNYKLTVANIAAYLGTPITVANGGTGAATLTGYVKGNGTSAMTASATVPGSDVSGNITGNAANVTGTVAVANGGTGQTSYTDGQLLIGNSTGSTLAKSTLTAGSGISITNGSGTITIAATGGGSGTVTSVSGTGTVNGLTLTGTVTSSGSLTLGGTLDLSSPPAIGGTSANTGAFTTLSATGVTTVQAGTSSAPAVTKSGDTDTGLYFPAANEAAITTGGTVAAAFNSNGLFFRNRIINGDMRIDQRNAGAAVTANDAFAVDRFKLAQNTDGACSLQQDSSVPAGFVNSLKYTTTTADGTLTTTQNTSIQQNIEGTNVADLAWGTANARTVTLSFWVRSSLTGTFGGAVSNSAINRSYPFSYAISVADTWEYKTVTIPGDTTGTWLTTTGIGMRVIFGLGVGPDRSGTAGAWAGSTVFAPTGAVSVIGTLNATWYVTGVQLETGSVATPFERRPYGTELMLCQRYYEKSYQQSITPGTVSNLGGVQFPVVTAIPNGYQVGQSVTFIVAKRATPTVTNYSYNGNTSRLTYSGGTDAGAGSATPNLIGEYSFQTVNSSGADVAVTVGVQYFFTASAEL